VTVEPKLTNRQQVRLGGLGLEVSAMGLGCMVLSPIYGTPDADEAAATFHRAVELGVTLFDTADAYSSGENERLVGRLIRPYRDRVTLATKFGIVAGDGGIVADSRPEYARASCDESLQRLGVDHIDLYYLHRADPTIPIEDTIGAMGELVVAGKVRYLGVCELSPEDLQRAHAVHPISALQSEWSLFERRLEQDCVPVARALNIGLVPYAPLGRGFLTGAIQAQLGADDHRSMDPRFIGDNLAANLRRVAVLRDLAKSVGATPAQVALAWLKAQGDDVVPIPGVERRSYLEENVAGLSIDLSAGDLATLDATFPVGALTRDAGQFLLRD
jgi:aryl-alcohol dehydrogenase-like predicted oxidoreductase